MTMLKKIHRGFTLVSAVFLLAVIAALGTFAITLSTTQQQGSALDLLGARAYQAARAGIEWGVYQVLQANGQAFASGCQTGVATQSLSLPNTLSAFTVTVSCSSTATTEEGNIIRVYRVTSTASSGVARSTSRVEREMTVTVWR